MNNLLRGRCWSSNWTLWVQWIRVKLRLVRDLLVSLKTGSEHNIIALYSLKGVLHLRPIL